MKGLTYIKIQLKNLFSNFQVSILYFIALPLIIGGAMGFMNKSLHGGEFKLDTIKIGIIDEDKSQLSENLVGFLRNDISKDILAVVDDDMDGTIVIPKGYDERIRDFQNVDITIKDNDTSIEKLNTVKSIIDSYHKAIYDSAKGINREEAVEKVKLEGKQQEDPFAFYSVSLIGLVCSMIIFGLSSINAERNEKNFDERILSTPNSKSKILNLKYVTYYIYSFLSILSYCFVYRFLGKAFIGNIEQLLIIIAIASLLITSLIIFLITMFTEKYAKIAAMVLFMIPILGGGMFTPNVSIISKIAPTYYISEVFSSYERMGNMEESIFTIVIIIIAAILLYLASIIKINLRRNKNEAIKPNLG